MIAKQEKYYEKRNEYGAPPLEDTDVMTSYTDRFSKARWP